MMEVEHGGDAIEAEPVEAELLDVVSQVGQKKTQDLPFGVVKQTAVPLLVW